MDYNDLPSDEKLAFREGAGDRFENKFPLWYRDFLSDGPLDRCVNSAGNEPASDEEYRLARAYVAGYRAAEQRLDYGRGVQDGYKDGLDALENEV